MKLKVVFSSFVLSVLFLLHAGITGADSSTPWFGGSQSPQIELKQQSAEIAQKTYWGAGCRDTAIQVGWIDATGTKITQTAQDCAHHALYGLFSTHGVRITGTNTSYQIKSSTNGSVSLYPVPNTKHALYLSATSSNTYKYVNIYKNLPTNMVPQKVQGEVAYYKLTKPHSDVASRMLLPDGGRAVVQDRTPVYSSDGAYMFANMGRAQVLIHIETQTTRIIGQDTNPSSGAPKVVLGISSTGKYVFVADSNKGSYRLYDTADCTKPLSLSGVEQCKFLDLGPTIKGGVSSIRQIVQANFLSDSKIELFISVNTASGPRTDRYIVSDPSFEQSGLTYLALGDSFASGEGAHEYTNITNSNGNYCHISVKSYTYLLKEELGYPTSKSVACSGAKIKDIHNVRGEYIDDDPQASGKSTPDYKEMVLSDFLPGYRRQHEFVGRYRPGAITLSIGGNDINFGKKLQYCILTQFSCFESAQQKAGIFKEIQNQFDGLVKTYTDLKQASPETRIYVVGYPSLVTTSGSCALNVRLSEAERMLADEITEDLNSVIKLATKRAGVFYVDASDIFTGYRLCEGNTWHQAVNGLTFGGDQPYGIGPISSASFHPNKLGHELYTEAIKIQTNGLTESMPEPDDSVSVTQLSSRLNPSNQEYGDVTLPILEDGLFGSLVEVGERAARLIKTSGYYLNPGDEYTVEMHSTPVAIGTATATDAETLEIDAQIPEGIEPGPHQIHIFGTNIAGEPIDIYKTVFLIASQEDYDGDGIINTQDGCTYVEESGIDSDGDGIDDGCDLVIEKPPVIEPTPEREPISTPAPVEEVMNVDERDDSQNQPEVEPETSEPSPQPMLDTGQSATSSDSDNDTTETAAVEKLENAQPTTAAPQPESLSGIYQPPSSNIYQTILMLLTTTPLGIAAVLLIEL